MGHDRPTATVRGQVRRRGPARTVAAALGLAACGSPGSGEPDRFEHATRPYEFVSHAGDTVSAVRGSFLVPENRSDPDSRRIRLSYVRFPAAAADPGPPIVYLAGGPGGSGVGAARGTRFPLFMALREIADVIAFDQRGTGDSSTIPPCRLDERLALDAPLRIDSLVAMGRRGAAACLVSWRTAGVDLAGYNALESARDLDDLRTVLGVDRVTLLGIGYGTHLALAALKVMGDRIDRLVLASAQGLDQTVKLPARTDAYFVRLQAALDEDPLGRGMFPDIVPMIRRVLDRLALSPSRVSIPSEEGPVEFLMGADDVRLPSAFVIGDPANGVSLLRLIAAADRGDDAPLGRFVYRFVRGQPLTFRGMPEAMDAASGSSAERLELVREQAQTALLGDVLNFPMPHLRDAFGDLDLGDDFRVPPVSDVPTLLLSGTLDGRTYPESQAEAVAGLSDVTHLVIEHAGHNLFMVSPRVTEVILAFLRGGDVSDTRIGVTFRLARP